MAENSESVRHCGQWVPDALRGNLAASKCRLAIRDDGSHDGPHKARLTIPHLGSVTFRWRGWRNQAERNPPGW